MSYRKGEQLELFPSPSSSIKVPVFRGRHYESLYDFRGLGVKVVREQAYKPRISICNPSDSLSILNHLYNGLEKEYFYSLILNARNQLMGIDLVSVGSLNASLVHPREVFKPAILLSAAAIICSHNHPSGDSTPSRDDIDLTRRLGEAGEIVGISLLDHLIFSPPGSLLSFKETGML